MPKRVVKKKVAQRKKNTTHKKSKSSNHEGHINYFKRSCCGKQQKVITKVEQEFGLDPGTINLKTVRSCVKRGNIDGCNPEQQSPLTDIELLIVECICQMSRMGESFCKDEIVQLIC